MRIEKDGHAIENLIDWEQFARPKKKIQWKKERSAYEFAKGWCGGGTPSMPNALHELLESRAETRSLIVDCAFPEHQIAFDDFGGEPRNADLAMIGDTPQGKVALTIEAKADEPFDKTVADTVAEALERRIVNPRSRGVERVAGLVRALFNPMAEGCPRVDALRYQLLTATAGTIAYALEHSASTAVLVIHEFITNKTQDEKHAQNATDFKMFLHRLAGREPVHNELTTLLGPFFVPGGPLFAKVPPLFIGKVATDIRSDRRH